MRPEDVYELTGVADPHISPDGTRVAYVVSRIDKEESEYRTAIWVAAVDGSSDPRAFTAGDKRDGSPRWSPDGKWLAFVSNRGGEKEKGQLYVIPAEGGEARKLTAGKESVEEVVWSPDSTRIAYTARVPDEAYEEEKDSKRAPRRFTRVFFKLDSVGWIGDRRKHIFVVPLEGGDPVAVTEGDSEDGSPEWSADGSQIYFTSLRGERWDVELFSRVYRVSAEGGEATQVSPGDDSFDSLSLSPDGTKLAFRFTLEDGTFPHHTQIGVMDVDGSNLKLLTESLDRQCGVFGEGSRPLWDGERILFTIEDGGNNHLYAVAADGSSAPELLVGGEQAILGYDVVDGTIAYASSSYTSLRELYVGTEGRKLTNVGEAFASGRTLVEPERFTAISKDGTEVDAWLVRPAGFEKGKRYPVLLNVHGGPFAQYGSVFFDEFQVQAGAGYAVLYSNPRGGSGYSEEWGRAIRGPIDGGGPGWGTVDYEDVLGVVDTALEKFDFLDPDRLGILGGSYGGFMTSWVISHDHRFKAAVSERAVNNMISAAGSSDIFWIFQRQFGGAFFENHDQWLAMSPTTYAKEIDTPVLILHSEADLRCNIEQAEHLFNILRLLDKDVELLRFPAESHELSRAGSPIHRVQRFEAILEWFDRYLK